MPKDAHLLSPMSQALLRAARMGQVNKPPPPPLEDEKDPGDDEDADADIEAGFLVRRWAVVPRHLEGVEPEYLAKRRKGLPSVYGGSAASQGNSGQMRKTKVRKIDADGNSSVWDVLVPEGQTVEGEIFEGETTSTQAPAPGTIVEGVGVVNAEGVVIAGDQMSTPVRRRPPPPKRKPKGPGRGRKKRVGFVSISNGAATVRRANGGPIGPRPINGSDLKFDPVSARGGAGNVMDVEMGEDLTLQEGEEVGEEGSEEDEDGDEGDDNDREEGELSPSPSAALSKFPSKSPIPHLIPGTGIPHDAPELTLTVPQIPIERDPSSSPDFPLAAGQSFHGAPVIKIDPVQEAVLVPGPGFHDIPVVGRISVEGSLPTKGSSANAVLPANHVPLNGLTVHSLPPKPPPVQNQQQMLFSDGEEDLLGSLERSLNRANNSR